MADFYQQQTTFRSCVGPDALVWADEASAPTWFVGVVYNLSSA